MTYIMQYQMIRC